MEPLSHAILHSIAVGGRILVIGDVMLDVIVKPEGPIVEGSDRRARIETHLGGSASNQAAWIASFGTPVTLAAKVGKDDVDVHQAAFIRAGVTPVLAVDEERHSGVLVTLVDATGQRTFLTDRGANENLDAIDLPDMLLDDVSILHISGYALFTERPRLAVLDLIRRAVDKGIVITTDPASAGFLAEHGGDAYFGWTAAAAICFPNEDEARALTGTSEKDEQCRILTQHYPLVVLKRGKDGAEICGNGGTVLARLPAAKVDVIDTTGAGDAFLAGFLSKIVAGDDLQTALSAAIKAGSKATTVFGGRPSSQAQDGPVDFSSSLARILAKVNQPA